MEIHNKGTELFDNYSVNYDDVLNQSISISGEKKEYFAEKRIAHLASQLASMNYKVTSILDFGCGTGSATPYLTQYFPGAKIVGVDVSAKSVEIAQSLYGNASFFRSDDYHPKIEFDLVFCNGVFHHIPLEEREKSVKYVEDSLRNGGYFAFWENNPWNPGTVYIMKNTPFDKDAITLNPLQSMNLLRKSGFEIISSDFLFFFPKMLAKLRFFEKYMKFIPFGAQYGILAKKR